MVHWLQTAWSTYVLHVEHNNGYQWWSGFGANFGEITVIGAAIALLRHHNCEQPGCWRLGHRHPDHGRPVCRKHYHHDLAPSNGSNGS